MRLWPRRLRPMLRSESVGFFANERANERFKAEFEAKIAAQKRNARNKAEEYFEWLNAKPLNVVARVALMSSLGRDVTFLQLLHQVAEEVEFTKSEQYVNDDGSRVILWLRCWAKIEKYSHSLTY